jgi:hypothetical protein
MQKDERRVQFQVLGVNCFMKSTLGRALKPCFREQASKVEMVHFQVDSSIIAKKYIHQKVMF